MNFSRTLQFIGLALAAVALSATPVLAQGTLTSCAVAASGLPSLNCTSNDVGLAIVEIPDPAPPQATTCAPGEMVTLNLRAELGSTARTRYDIGVFVATDGGDAFTGTCGRFILTPTLEQATQTSPNMLIGPPAGFTIAGIYQYWDAEGTGGADVCGDLEQDVLTTRDFSITVPCQDLYTIPAGSVPPYCFPGSCGKSETELELGPDGKLDPLGAVVSWEISSNNDCTGVLDAVPTNKAKCNGVALPLLTDVFVETPGIQLVKTGAVTNDVSPAGPSLGDTVTYSYAVTNTGNVELINVAVTDPHPGLSMISCPQTTLTGGTGTPPMGGGSMTCTATYVITQADVDAGRIANTGTANGEAPSGAMVQDTDDESIDIMRVPDIMITKEANRTGLVLGDTITYTYVITNTGNVTLTGVTATDDLIPMLSCMPSLPTTLAPGGTVGCTGTHVVSQADINAGVVTNTVETMGTPPAGVTPSPVTDEASVTIQQGCLLSIELSKTGTGGTGPGGIIQVGDNLTYSYVVTNTGTCSLSISVLDDPLGSITCQDTMLANNGDSTTCSAMYTVLQSDIDRGDGCSLVNEATATGSFNGSQATATDDFCFTVEQDPSIDIVKSANPNSGLTVGTEITYTYLVTNDGNVTLTSVQVTDAHDGLSAISCGMFDGALSPGEMVSCTATYTVDQDDVDAGTIPNTGVATGMDPNDNPVEDTAMLTLSITRNPSIMLVKSYDSNDDADMSGTVTPGDTITYGFVITNNGNVTLSNVSLDDDKLGLSGFTCGATTLAPGESTNCTADYAVTEGDAMNGSIFNEATASGDWANGSVSDNDDETVEVETPEPPVAIPTLSEWGLIIFAGLLALFGAHLFRRRSDWGTPA